eukprot:3982506-Prymnesium_polylepis.1
MPPPTRCEAGKVLDKRVASNGLPERQVLTAHWGSPVAWMHTVVLPAVETRGTAQESLSALSHVAGAPLI